MATIVSIWGSQRTLWGWEARVILRVAGEAYDRVEQLAWPGQTSAPSDIQARADALAAQVDARVAAEEMAANVEEALG